MKKVFVTLTMLWVVGCLGLADDGSVVWPGVDEGSVEWPTTEFYTYEDIDPIYEDELQFWWKVDWHCFKECYMLCYDMLAPKCKYLEPIPKLYSACIKAVAVFCGATCVKACWR